MWARILRTAKVRTLAYVVEHGGVIEGYVVFTHQPEPTVRYDVGVKDLVGSTGTYAAGASRTSALIRVVVAERIVVRRSRGWRTRRCRRGRSS